jgi:hypothetical protein
VLRGALSADHAVTLPSSTALEQQRRAAIDQTVVGLVAHSLVQSRIARAALPGVCLGLRNAMAGVGRPPRRVGDYPKVLVFPPTERQTQFTAVNAVVNYW